MISDMRWAQQRQILDVLFDPIVGDVIGGRLGS
jgi:hypothetical protein